MQTPRIVRGQPEKMFAVVRNLHTGNLVDGDVVVWLLSTDTPPTGWSFTPTASQSLAVVGTDVKQSGASANLKTIGGVMALGAAGLAQGEWGTMQVYGFHSNVKCGTATAGTEVATVATAGTCGDAASAIAAVFLGVCTRTAAAGRGGIQIMRM